MKKFLILTSVLFFVIILSLSYCLYEQHKKILRYNSQIEEIQKDLSELSDTIQDENSPEVYRNKKNINKIEQEQKMQELRLMLKQIPEPLKHHYSEKSKSTYHYMEVPEYSYNPHYYNNSYNEPNPYNKKSQQIIDTHNQQRREIDNYDSKMRMEHLEDKVRFLQEGIISY